MLRRTFHVICVLFLGFIGIALIGGNDSRTRSNSDQSSIRECQRRGVAYFKEIGSYPLLSDGRLAAEVAADRCSRSLAAFG